MIVQNIVPINDFRGRSMTQSEEREKGRNKEKKEYLNAAEGPARLPTKWVYALAAPLNDGRRNPKCEDA